MTRVLITGASDGIGRALVDVYLAEGAEVFCSGRRPRGEITPALPDACHYISADLTQDIEPLLAMLPPALDIAILNAGAGKVAPPQDHSPAEIKGMIALNTTAPLLLAQRLKTRLKGGKLAFIGSTAAKGRHGDFSVYAATKAAMSGAARSLALEWAGDVEVLMLHPGPTATGMHDKAGLGQIAARRLFTPPAKVARALAASIARGKNRRLGMGFTMRHAIGSLIGGAGR
ncbi:MAG: SDR family oxidoreductase [Pseudomonadota bacterium]